MPAARRGERKLQILQVLAQMLEDPKGERITTAALAAKLDVSEAALYRHFASKAQMFEGLIEFIENSIFGLANKIAAEEESGLKQLHATLAMLLGFAERNPGMTRVLIGDALVNEHERLQARINQLHDRIEATLKQCLRVAASQAHEGEGQEHDQGREGSGEGQEGPSQGHEDAGQGHEGPDPAAHANMLMCYVIGRWHQYAKSGFRRLPTEQWEKQWPWLA